MVRKNDELELNIIDNGFEGEGIACLEDGMRVFIPETIVGEKVRAKILKVNKNYCFAKCIQVIEKSPIRQESDCKYYSKCGGCNFRHIRYDESLDLKKKAVENTLRKALKRDVFVNEVIKCEEPLFYRNKLSFPVREEDGIIKMGVFAKRSHRINEIDECLIQNKLAQKIARDCFEFCLSHKINGYNEDTLTGLLRHIIVRIGVKTNEAMLTLVLTDWNLPYEKELIDFIVLNNSEVKTIVKNLNNKNTNVILGTETKIIYGDGYIFDYLGDKKFKISPLSFYQINPLQTVKLYSKAIEYADLKDEDTILDLYCGIGTIGIFASNKIKKLYGIETIPQAIENAKENAKLNNIENAEFFVGNVEDILPTLIKEKDIKPEVVFLDPPRKGVDKNAIDTLIENCPKKIVYVSCNPSSFARDLSLLEEKYELGKVAICDMFPGTSHCETIAVLTLR